MYQCKKHCLKELGYFIKNQSCCGKKEKSTWFLGAALRARHRLSSLDCCTFPGLSSLCCGYEELLSWAAITPPRLCTTAPKSTPDRYGFSPPSRPPASRLDLPEFTCATGDHPESLKSHGWSSDALLAAPEQLDPGIGANPRVTVRSAELLGN